MEELYFPDWTSVADSVLRSSFSFWRNGLDTVNGMKKTALRASGPCPAVSWIEPISAITQPTAMLAQCLCVTRTSQASARCTIPRGRRRVDFRARGWGEHVPLTPQRRLGPVSSQSQATLASIHSAPLRHGGMEPADGKPQRGPGSGRWREPGADHDREGASIGSAGRLVAARDRV